MYHKKGYQNETLCWTCQHSCPKKGEDCCPWCEDKQPVPGWYAVYHKAIKSFRVIDCPMYLKDTDESLKLGPGASISGVINLLEASLQDFASTYASALRQRDRDMIHSIEHQIRRPWFKMFANGMVEPDDYIHTMRSKYGYCIKTRS